MEAAQIDVGGNHAFFQNVQDVVGLRFEQTKVTNRIKSLVFDRGQPAGLRFALFELGHLIHDMLPSARRHALVTATKVEPGSPWQNGWIESFHARLRDECLNRKLLLNLHEARVVIENFRIDYNQDRPHSRLGYLSLNQWIKNNLQARAPLGLLASLRPGLSSQTTSQLNHK